MSREDDIIKSLGRLEKGQENLEGFIKAVSSKIDREVVVLRGDINSIGGALDKHENDQTNSHGSGAVTKSWQNLALIITIALGAFAVGGYLGFSPKPVRAAAEHR